MNVEPTNDIVRQIFKTIDTDNSQSIERVELVNFLKSAGDFNLAEVNMDQNKVGNQQTFGKNPI